MIDLPIRSPEARLRALDATALLDTPPAAAFDRVTALVRRLLGVPVSLVSLVDRDRQFFLSQDGLAGPWAEARQTPLSHSFCQHVVTAEGPVRVENAPEDPVFCDNLAIRDLGVVGYLGVPVRAPGGAVLGSLCAITPTPRAWADADVATMEELAAIVEAEVALQDALRAAAAEAADRREAVEELQVALDAAHLGRWQLDLGTGLTTRDGWARAIHGAVADAGPVPTDQAVAAVHPDDRAEVEAAYREVVAVGVGGRFAREYRVLAPDGATRWVRAAGQVRQGAAGPRLVGVAWDVTDEREAEEALRQSEARLGFALDVAGLGQWELNLDTGAAVRSLRHDEIFGYPEGLEDWTYERFLEHVLPEDRHAVEGAFAEAAAQGTDWSFECRIRRADGATRWIEGRGRMSFLAGPGHRLMVGTVADVTPRVEAEAAVRDSEARFRLLADTATDVIVTLDEGGTIRYVNAAVEAVFGYAPAALVGAPFARLVPDGSGERRSGVEVLGLRADGAEVPLSISFGDYATPDGRYHTGIIRDESARHAAEAALRALNDELESRVAERTVELERSNAELDQFAYVASHDLKAPIRAIDSLAAWIAEDVGDGLPPASARHLVLLRSRAARMEGLLDSLLTYSRVGRQEAAPEPVDTAALVRDAVDLVAPPEGFDVRLEGDFPVAVTARAPLGLVLRNLIGNAIKHHDRADGRVTVSAEAADGWALFAVADDGPGIAPAYQARIFGLFQTLRPRDEVEGSGMGLSIVRKAVESRGGRVAVASEGRGTTFRFSWPLRPDIAPLPQAP